MIYALNGSGLEAEGFEAPSEFYEALAKKTPELVLLDVMLPEEDGLTVLKKLRSAPATRRLPVIMLSAKGSEYDKVAGLDGGADDYIAKPFGTLELISRVKALLRRTAADAPSDEITVGELTVRPSRREALARGEIVRLTHKEFDLLLLLMKNEGRVFSRDDLLREVWGFDFTGESRTVDVHVRTLRSKLGEAGNVIVTVRGVGYKAGGEP